MMASPSGSRRLGAGLAAVALLLTLAGLPYVRALQNGYTIDDGFVYADNAFIRDLANLPLLVSPRYFDISAEASYRPICTLTYFLDWHLFGANAWGPHLTNLILYGLTVLAVYALFRQLSRERRVALLGASLFALHPLHSEVVCSIAFREDLLVALLIPLALAAHLRARDAARLWGWLAASWTCYALALLSKESAIVYPALVLLVACTEFRDPPAPRRPALRIATTAMLLLLTALFLMLRFHWLRAAGEASLPQLGGSLLGTLIADVKIQARYLWLFLVPHPLRAFYSSSLFSTALDLRFWISAAALAAVAALTVRLRHWPYALLAFGWWFITLAPVANIYPIFNPMAERYLFLPSIGACLFAASVAAAMWRGTPARPWPRNPRHVLLLAAAGIAVTWIVLTTARVPAWRSNQTIWAAELPLAPRDPYVLANAAAAAFEIRDYDATLRHARAALVHAGQYPHFDITPTFVAIGAAHMMLGQPDAALAAMQRAETGLPCRPDVDAAVWRNLAALHAARGEPAEAIDYLERALRLDPFRPQHWAKLAYLQLGLNRTDAARQSWEQARAQNPSLPAFEELEKAAAAERKPAPAAP